MKAFFTLFLSAVLSASAAAGEPAVPEKFGNSFEDPAEVSGWQCQPGITIERTDRWASEGKSSLQINIPPKTPWFGIYRPVQMEEFRAHEFLEFDLHAITEVDTVALTLHAEKFQDFMLLHNRLQPGETIHVRVRLTGNEIVRFGDAASLSIWMVNATASEQTILLDNIHLTGYGGEHARLEQLIKNITAANLTDAQTEALKTECQAKLGGSVSAGDVDGLKARWDDLLASAQHADAAYLLVGLSPLQKVKRTDRLSDLPTAASKADLQIEMARNEYETRQLVFLAKNDMADVTLNVSASDLKGPGGATIPSGDIELRLVDEVDISGTTQFPGEKLVGNWPDPLLPNAPFTINPGDLRSVWLTVRTRASTQPGTYHGSVSIRDGKGNVQSMPLNVTVWDFALPEKSSLKTFFNAWSHNWATFYNYARYPRDAWFHKVSFEDIPRDRLLAATDFFRSYRATLQGLDTYGVFDGKAVSPVLQTDGSLNLNQAPKPGSATWNEVAAAALKNDGNLFVGSIGGNTKLHLGEASEDAAVIELTKSYLELIEAQAKKSGWKNNLYFYLLDEPHNNKKSGGWPAALKEASLLKKLAPDIKTFVASGVFLPTPKEQGLYRDVDAWCMLLDRTPFRDAESLRARGKEVWWYSANVTYAPFPTWSIHSENFAARILPLLSFKYNMDGVLLWAATLFFDANSYPQSGKRWPERPWSMKGWLYQPGEGHLCYPGKDGEFWPSIRLSNWRDGMEDFEYLKLLQDKMPGLSPDQQEKARKILSLNAIAAAPYDYSRNPADFADLRRQIAELLNQTKAK